MTKFPPSKGLDEAVVGAWRKLEGFPATASK
jgi:hypothetical protein